MTYKLIHASAHDTGLPDKSVHMVVTSPPYYGLRAYAGEQDIEWPEVLYSPMPGLPQMTIAGCKPGCKHEWADGPVKSHAAKRDHDGRDFGNSRGQEPARKATSFDMTQGAYCLHCGGWRGGLGSEPTIEAYIGHLILVAREIFRILRDDGTFWCNLGDSYSANRSYQVPDSKHKDVGNSQGMKAPPGTPAKNLYLIPYRFALAAQADGWYVRSDICWAKGNPMPESVTDRPTKSHEYIYLLAKSEKYFYDAEAIKEPANSGSLDRYEREKAKGMTNDNAHKYDFKPTVGAGIRSQQGSRDYILSGRNKRSVWYINTHGSSAAHFATFPIELPTICIKAGTSSHGGCANCGAPWERTMEKDIRVQAHWEGTKQNHAVAAKGKHGATSVIETGSYQTYKTTGWQPTCACNADIAPATVADFFNGSGTTGRAALQLGRSYIGIDISQEYITDLCEDDNRAANGLPKLLKGGDVDLSNMPLWAEGAA